MKGAELATLLGGAGVLLLVVGWAGGTGRLRRNHLVGIRLPSTMRSPEAWDAGHRAAASMVVASGVASMVGALAAAVWGTTRDRVTLLGLLTAAAILGCVGVAGARASRAADRVGRR